MASEDLEITGCCKTFTFITLSVPGGVQLNITIAPKEGIVLWQHERPGRHFRSNPAGRQLRSERSLLSSDDEAKSRHVDRLGGSPGKTDKISLALCLSTMITKSQSIPYLDDFLVSSVCPNSRPQLRVQTFKGPDNLCLHGTGCGAWAECMVRKFFRGRGLTSGPHTVDACMYAHTR